MKTEINEINQILKKNNLTISTAESITAGLLQDALASASGSSHTFRGGVTAYDIDTKEDLLGIDRVYAEDCNCVSERTVREMAQGARELFRADIGIATTGYAEHFEGKSPHAYFAIAMDEKLVSGVIQLEGFEGRQCRRHAVCDYVITQLNAELFELFPSLEIEYKFAIKPEYLGHIIANADNQFSIKQCYIAANDTMVSRIRIINGMEAFETTKLDGNVEVEYQIPLGKARTIYSAFKNGVGTVEKMRYVINYECSADELKIEVDVFEGRHKGLMFCEIEVPYEDYALSNLPHWIDTETKVEVRSNAELAMME